MMTDSRSLNHESEEALRQEILSLRKELDEARSANAAKEAGATLVGDVLKLDDTNEADQTDSKIAAWVEAIKAAL